MTTTTLMGYLIPPLISALLGGIYAMVRMWGEITQLKNRLSDQVDMVRELKTQVQSHDQRLIAQGETLSRIAEGVEWIKHVLAESGRSR